MRAVAVRLGVSHTWIAKTESGERRLDMFEFVDLCFALGLDPFQGLKLVIGCKSSYDTNLYTSTKAAESGPKFGLKPRNKR